MKKILVIDDDAAVLKSTMMALRRHGYEAFGAEAANEGVQISFAQRPNLVLSDVQMGESNGFDVLKELRSNPATSDIPVILMTGEPNKADARYSMEHGADDYLQKPFSMSAMLAAVSARLERQEGINRAGDAHQAAERLSTAEKIRLQTTALEAAANGIAITQRDGKILWINPAFTALTGYEPGEIIGRSHSVLNSGQQEPGFYEELWQTVLAGKVWHGELVNRRKDGSFYDEEMTITPLRGPEGDIQNFIAIKQDISARKFVEDALQLKQNELRVLFDWMPAMIWFKDTQNNILRVNQRVADSLGRKVEEVEGWPVADIYPEIAEQVFELDKQVIASKSPMLGIVEKFKDKQGRDTWIQKDRVPVCDKNGEVTGIVVMAHDITERKIFEQQLEHVRNEHAAVLNSLGEGVHWIDIHGNIKFENPAAAKMLGYEIHELIGKPAHLTMHHTRADGSAYPKDECSIYATLRDGKVRRVADEVFWRKDGTSFAVDYICTPVYEKDGSSGGSVVIFTDITERKQLEAQLVQAKKLESVGQLASGIAHEINTPTQYVGDNTRFVKESFAAVLKVLQSHQELLAAAKQNAVTPEMVARGAKLLAESDLEYLCEQIPAALSETLEGVERISKIVRAMKEFSHPGGREKIPADLNRAIQSTVTVAKNEWKYVADLKLELAEELPLVPCFVGEFNQCILNLVVNAAHAIGDVVGKNPGSKGVITVQSLLAGDFVEVRVTDTGTGIPESARSKIFEPFFTTKDVGKGTGQGLSIIYGSIVKRHGGTVSFETETGKGTTFIIRLPLKSSGQAASPETEAQKIKAA